MTETPPFVGLSPFGEETAEFFCARDVDSRMVANNVMSRRVTVLYGASGVGKSSLIHAGLPGTLRRNFGTVLLGIFREWHEVGRARTWLSAQKRRALRQRRIPTVLVLDQFEEYFLYRREDTHTSFEAALARAIRSEQFECHLLISLREDRLHLLEHLRERLPDLLNTVLELEHLDEEAVRTAIERPVEVFNEKYPGSAVTIEPGFTDQVVRELESSALDSGQPRLSREGGPLVELPFLQLAMRAVWCRMQAEGRRTLDRGILAAANGVQGIIRSHIYSVFGKPSGSDRQQHGSDSARFQLDDAERELAGQVFHYLVTPSGGKLAYAADDLAESASETARPVEGSDVEQLLGKLSQGDARVLRRVGNRFELFHDVLAKPILEWRAEYLERGLFAVLVDAASGEIYDLNHYGTLFGRLLRTGTPTPLSLRSVSRTHLLLFKTGVVLDLRSRYGTTLNAVPVPFSDTSFFLESGDVLCLANTAVLTFFWPKDAKRAHSAALKLQRGDWGYLVDGKARRVRQLNGPEIMLNRNEDGSLDLTKRVQTRTFARLRYEDGRAVLIGESADDLVNLQRLSAYATREITIKPGAEFELGLRQINFMELVEDGLKGVDPLECVDRGVFRIEETPFEIVLCQWCAALAS